MTNKEELEIIEGELSNPELNLIERIELEDRRRDLEIKLGLSKECNLDDSSDCESCSG